MKALLKTVKGKILAAGAGVVVVAAVVVGAVFLFSGEGVYRSIAVEQLLGTSLVSNTEGEQEAYKGMHLQSGDDVQVQKDANMTLKIDADKHLYAQAFTHFKVECVDDEKSGKKVIHLMEGSVLNRLENALKEGESYTVETPNATMAVRGTVFRVTVDRDEDGLIYTLVEVFDGKVQVDLKEENGDYNGVTETFGAGESALIRGNTEFAEFVVGEEGVYKQEIAYKQIPQDVAKVLVEYIDNGEELCIGKELLMDYTALAEHKMETITGKDASCTEEGYKEVWCVVCNEVTETIVLPAKGHTLSDWEVALEPTCLEVGNRKRICSTCKNYYEEEDIAALGHAKGELVVTKEADCINEGVKTSTCTRCGKVLEEVKIPKTNHNYGSAVTVDATCTTDGSQTTTCSKCGKKSVSTIAALGHTKGELVVTKKADCNNEGTKTATCTRCGEVMEEVKIPTTKHTYGSPVIVDATCTTNGSQTITCSICGQKSVSEIEAYGHTPGGWTTVREASCTTEGLNQIACTVCGQVVQSSTTAALGHSYGVPVVVDPTCTVNGSSTETCAICGGTQTTVLAATGHKTSADMTGHSEPVYNDIQQMVGITCMQKCTIDTCGETIVTPTTVSIDNDGMCWCDNCGGMIQD